MLYKEKIVQNKVLGNLKTKRKKEAVVFTERRPSACIWECALLLPGDWGASRPPPRTSPLNLQRQVSSRSSSHVCPVPFPLQLGPKAGSPDNLALTGNRACTPGSQRTGAKKQLLADAGAAPAPQLQCRGCWPRSLLSAFSRERPNNIPCQLLPDSPACIQVLTAVPPSRTPASSHTLKCSEPLESNKQQR